MGFRGYIQIFRHIGPVFGLGHCDTGVWVSSCGCVFYTLNVLLNASLT
jgi:hypothetical protein